MTKKHFEEIANNLEYRALVIFNGEATYQEKWYALSTLLALVYDLVQTFSQFNKNFDGGRILSETKVNILKYRSSLSMVEKGKLLLVGYNRQECFKVLVLSLLTRYPASKLSPH